jgi:hypothetical protein
MGLIGALLNNSVQLAKGENPAWSSQQNGNDGDSSYIMDIIRKAVILFFRF